VLSAASLLLGLCGIAIAVFGRVPIAGGLWLFGLLLILGPHD
jgi:hypothetical protein